MWLVLAWAAAVASPQRSFALECSGRPEFGRGTVLISQRLPANHCRRSARADKRGDNDPIRPAWAPPPRPVAGAADAAIFLTATATITEIPTTSPSPPFDGVDGSDAEVAAYNRTRRQQLLCCLCRGCCNCV